jgi:hypothetical protein
LLTACFATSAGTRDVVVRLAEPRFGGGLLRFCDGERGLERLGIDLIRKSPAHEQAFPEVHRVEEAFDPGADVDVLKPFCLATSSVAGDVLRFDGGDVPQAEAAPAAGFSPHRRRHGAAAMASARSMSG